MQRLNQNDYQTANLPWKHLNYHRNLINLDDPDEDSGVVNFFGSRFISGTNFLLKGEWANQSTELRKSYICLVDMKNFAFIGKQPPMRVPVAK